MVWGDEVERGRANMITTTRVGVEQTDILDEDGRTNFSCT